MLAACLRARRWACAPARAVEEVSSRPRFLSTEIKTHKSDPGAKVVPVVLVAHEEADEHARVKARERHLAHLVRVVRP